MKVMETLQDLIEEAKLRTVYWALCIFAISYFLTHTSKSMWMNVPIAVLVVSGLRILFNEVEFRWKVHNVRRHTYLSFLEKKQLSVNDSRLSTAPPPPKWKRKVDSPVVEAAMHDFVDKLLHDFVIDLWYSDITPDKEAPELIRAIIMDVLGEISGRVKDVNLVDLLTSYETVEFLKVNQSRYEEVVLGLFRDVVDLIGDHLDLFRRNQIAIGVDVMGTLSSEERDERLKHHLLTSKELHPALISPECEYKVLQRLMGGLLAIVLRPREAQCPLVRCIARELLTCLVMEPLMNFASPGYINELIEYILLANKDEGGDGSPDVEAPNHGHAGTAEHVEGRKSDLRKDASSYNQTTDITLFQPDNLRELSSGASGSSLSNTLQDESIHSRPADWARILEAATQRRTEVLMPENLENLWTKGRNYKKKLPKNAASGLQAPVEKGSVNSVVHSKDLRKEVPVRKAETSITMDNEALGQLPRRPRPDTPLSATSTKGTLLDPLVDTGVFVSNENKNRLKRSNSTSDLTIRLKEEDIFSGKGGGPFISEFYSAELSKRTDVHGSISASDMVLRSEGQHVPKLRCRVIGAYFEKLGSKSFAVYSIAVTDANNKTWFVKRRYRNFERLHRHLKDIPNYTLHLPPKRIFSSSTEDAFVHQRCIQLDKYLQDLLSIANVAEQHEVWDFLSVTSKNYSFGKSSSVMKTLAVNVDDAVDDIVRQFKGVSDGLMRKVVGSPPSLYEATTSDPGRNLSWNDDEINKLALRQGTSDSVNSFSDNEEGDKDGNHSLEESGYTEQASGWHSDNELNSKDSPPRVVKHDEESRSVNFENRGGSGARLESLSPETSLMLKSEHLEDPMVPPEWTPPNLSVPILNLVDNIFQLKRRGWLRRQVFWISKQILQLMMEDAIDDWLLRQIHVLRREDVIAHGIRWIQDVLWPGGTFFLRLRAANDSQSNQGPVPTTGQTAGSRVSKPGSFEQQLEAARRASDVKKMIFNGAPTTLVSLIGHKQYRRCAKDIYYFLQSTTCLKQLAYGILELLLISLFPELRDLVTDIHEKTRTQPA